MSNSDTRLRVNSVGSLAMSLCVHMIQAADCGSLTTAYQPKEGEKVRKP